MSAVVSPAFKAMKWSEPERAFVRSHIGEQYAKAGSANVALLVFSSLAVTALAAGF